MRDCKGSHWLGIYTWGQLCICTNIARDSCSPLIHSLLQQSSELHKTHTFAVNVMCWIQLWENRFLSGRQRRTVNVCS
ncbi:hypothetical protein L3Y34_018725 [Caenorhabditis briggsae]|uniref:Uncharacterized protein n=1 Tax=Caenorhabditis briggsae TaxID=6238 RepID=A0AAE9DNV8_CAEBR|nr:hypothetical protein L3Y34_018725 [Caenorhabditis briggsae]